MKEIYDLYIFLLMMASAIGLLIGYVAWKKRDTQGAIPLAILMLSIALWAFFQMMVFLTPELETKRIFANLRYLGIQVAPIAFYALAWEYKHRTKSMKLKGYLKIMVFPAICFEALWNNHIHQRFYTRVYMDNGLLIMDNGPIFWINMIYLYFFVTIGIYLFIKAFQGSHSKHRQQALIIVFAAFIPIISNLVFNFGLLPIEYIDITPISFFATGLLFYFAIFQFNLLDLVPIARDLLVEEMKDMVIVLDRSHRVLDMNKRAREFLLKSNDSKSNYIGADLFTVARDWKELSQAIKDSSIANIRINYNDAEVMKCFDLNKSDIYNKNGSKIGEIIDLRDVTSLENALLEAKEARQAAESANQSKGYFLANMSHEIRTPMNAIIGIAEMIDSEDLDGDEIKRYNRIIVKSAESLLSIINDILDLSKVEAGKMELEKATVDVRQIIEDTVEVFRISTANRSVIIATDLDRYLPQKLTGDPVRIRQILTNLIGNSIKFTKAGKIEIALKYLGRRDDRNLVEICISDTGLGIPEEKLDSIFESFKQVDSSTTRKYGGTGLGLSIVKSLVELMDGSIVVRSKPGEGSRFTVSLPLEDAQMDMPEEPAVKQIDDSRFIGLKILVAEDHHINREIIRLNLKKLGCTFEIVENGRLAVEQYERKTFDVLLMDVQMPEMDGLEASERIRAFEKGTGQRLPIIALTASAMKEDIDKCYAAGMDAHISKPIRIERLKEVLEALVLENL